MSDEVIAPENTDELHAVVAGQACVLPIGNRTKPPLSRCDAATLVSLRSLQGIVQYEPSEFTFTALAGTTITEIAAVLAEKGQSLPFDPMLAAAGATIGGTVAAGLSGPGRFRYGGIRDFLLGVRFLSGDGNVINAGGKVVKNAAGFDIPKFFVGSLGRFGTLTELTFKVFPKPIATQTLTVQCESHRQALDRIASAASSRWELDAIDYRPQQQTLYLRIAGPEQANAAIADSIRSKWGEQVGTLADPEAFWQSVRDLSWVVDAPIAVKVPTTPAQFLRLSESIDAGRMHVSVAGNVVWILLSRSDDVAQLDSQLRSMAIPGLVVRGEGDGGPSGSGSPSPCIGQWPKSNMLASVKTAMDPASKFPPLL